MPKNYGLDLKQERLEQRGDEWQFGAVSQPCNVVIPLAERGAYMPAGEVQRGKEDTMDCASRGPNNILAEKFSYAYAKGLFSPENMKWLAENGYVVDGRIDFSDAFVAINSGTTRTGNSLKAPLQAIHAQGLIPKAMLPLDPSMTFDEYMDPARITRAMKALGDEFRQRFVINYEQVKPEHFAEALQTDFLNVCAYAWPVSVNGIYPRVPADPNHVFELFAPEYVAFDNYIDFSNGYTKNLAPDYYFWDYGYRVYISAEGQVIQSLKDQAIAVILQIIANIRAQIAALKTLAVPPVPLTTPRMEPPVVVLTPLPPMPPAPERYPTLDDFCGAIRDNEGVPPHDRSYRNNNPGNCRLSQVGYFPKYGIVKEDRSGVRSGQPGFAIFRDYATGWLYLKNLVISRIRQHPEWTIYEFIADPIEGYSPSSDGNDPEDYADFIGKRLGVDSRTFKIEHLIS